MRVVFDLDGTLANIEHRLPLIHRKKGKDWDAFFARCNQDRPIEHTLEVLSALLAAQHHVEIWSGRGEGRYGEIRLKTVRWLEAQDIGVQGLSSPDHVSQMVQALRMRPFKDHRPDDELKREWLMEERHYHQRSIDLVLDDRDRLVKMWRAEGVPCFQVAPGNF